MNKIGSQHIWSSEKEWTAPCLIHFNGGSCAGCDLEIGALCQPCYESARAQLGLRISQNPREANVLLCTGAITRPAEPALRELYAEMGPGTQVVALGTCAVARHIFKGCYNVVAQVDEVLPVDLYITGCPPRPLAILAGFKKLQAASWQRVVKLGPIGLMDGDAFPFQNGTYDVSGAVPFR